MEAIDRLVEQFFAAFTNRGRPANLDVVHDLVIPECIIVKNSGPTPEVFTLDRFLTTRREMLSDGRLVDFEEAELEQQTCILGSVAQRISLYHKSGVASGATFHQRGIKIFQLIDTPKGWRISAVAWDDHRLGFSVPEHLRDASM